MLLGVVDYCLDFPFLAEFYLFVVLDLDPPASVAGTLLALPVVGIVLVGFRIDSVVLVLQEKCFLASLFLVLVLPVDSFDSLED